MITVTGSLDKRYTHPPRPCPPDFAEVYLEKGWGALAHYRTSPRVLLRWLGESGGDALRAEREERLRTTPRSEPVEIELEPLAPAPRLPHHRRRRACPEDFRDVFLAMGWDAKEHYRTSSRVFRRWIDESGGDALRAERAALIGIPDSARPQLRSENRKPTRLRPLAVNSEHDEQHAAGFSLDPQHGSAGSAPLSPAGPPPSIGPNARKLGEPRNAERAWEFSLLKIRAGK